MYCSWMERKLRSYWKLGEDDLLNIDVTRWGNGIDIQITINGNIMGVYTHNGKRLPDGLKKAYDHFTVLYDKEDILEVK